MRSKNEIHTNTILAESAFLDEFLDTIVLHIPHASLNIPHKENYLVSEAELNEEMLKMTDLCTDVIYDLGNEVTKVVFDYNRVYCDVERLPDESEVMHKVGRGFYYTRTDAGEPLRTLDDRAVVKNIYDAYHKNFSSVVGEKIKSNGFATIIDCHSFSDTPFETDLIKETRPDICLGTDDYHTPKWLLNQLKNHFENLGLVVGINNPYSGTIVPLDYYQKNENVHSIMIEINRKLFMKGDHIDYKKALELNRVMKKAFQM